ncbi:MAG: ZIP family metal transporter, partial [Clostridia bacterium]|nr:ZIP family metal transporter [Clostridia bacterium]
MWLNVAIGILIPFLGTALGAACVFFMKDTISDRLNQALAGFAGGIMVSASFFSLILPALEQTKDMGVRSLIPVVSGFLTGMLFLLALDLLVPHVHLDKSEEGPKSGLKKTTKLLLAVSLHNLPEGMVVGIVFAGWM